MGILGGITMHMADALISMPVGATMSAGSIYALRYSAKQISLKEDEKLIVKMGVLSAFVFAGQMINIAIPGTGASGHISGALLLSALLGPFPAFICMGSILLVQALLFSDGGLLAFGCNLFNMGFWACFIGYPMILKPFIKRTMSTKRLYLGSIFGAIISLQLGALGVVLQTMISGVTKLSFLQFLLLMQPIHLLIGIGEGVITAGILQFLFKANSEFLEVHHGKGRQYSRKDFAAIGGCTVFVGSLMSLVASGNPDGLEWSVEKIGKIVPISSGIHDGLEAIQGKISVLADYSFSNGGLLGTAISGLVGIAVLWGVFLFINRRVKAGQNGTD